jgi:aspartate racemase
MNIDDDSVIGIVGGMGPEAGLNLFKKILTFTNAVSDQQHLSVMLMSFPKHIEDRTSFLDGSTPVNPAFSIAAIIKKLEVAGAKIIGMACNTSYSPKIYNVILKELQNVNSQVKLVNMPVETCRYIKENCPGIQRVGVMATNGTHKAEIYKNLLENFGYDVVVADFKFQNDVIHKMIYDKDFGIKSSPNKITSEVKSLMHEALLFFKRQRTDAIILGCTELSLVLEDKVVQGMRIFDATEVFAKALVREGLKIEQSELVVDSQHPLQTQMKRKGLIASAHINSSI